MTTLETSRPSAAKGALSGKRVALIGFQPATSAMLANLIAEAEGFTRSLIPQQVSPSSDTLKPFELILLDVEAANGTEWVQAEQLAPVANRCIAMGEIPSLLQLASAGVPCFKEYCAAGNSAGELLLRCTLGLRSQAPLIEHAAPPGSTVILADDDTSITALVRRALERNGLNCEIAATGNDALSLISQVKPCAAILDVHMPTIDGFDVLSRIKSSPELARTRVILLTGSEHEADIIRGFSLGADDYVCKPFNPMELTIRLMRVIGRL